MRKTINFFLKTIFIIILIILIIKFYEMIKTNYFNEMYKAEYYMGTSEFSRDKEVRYSDMNSYKIESNEFNDAMYCFNIDVNKNTFYKITCMIKTEDVINENGISNGGAHICIADTVEKSKSLVGTNDWQKVEFLFDSKNRENVTVGFRLGGYDDNSSGKVWFSDFKLEMGGRTEDNKWKFACFIFKNIDVDLGEEHINIQMNDNEIRNVSQNMSRFKTSCEELSRKQYAS